MDKIVCLDFDGVLCDSIDECLVTSYNTYYQQNVGLAGIPQPLEAYFRAYRYLVRPAAQYFLIFRAFENGMGELDESRFEEMYKQYFDEALKFETDFFEKRNNTRTDLQYWLSLHKLFDNVKAFLDGYSSRFFVVTTKDKRSVELISTFHGYRDKIKSIYSKEDGRDKKILFSRLIPENREFIGNKQLCFVDDNEWHLGDVEDMGLHLEFAAWGYSPRQFVHQYKEINNLNHYL